MNVVSIFCIILLMIHNLSICHSINCIPLLVNICNIYTFFILIFFYIWVIKYIQTMKNYTVIDIVYICIHLSNEINSSMFANEMDYLFLDKINRMLFNISVCAILLKVNIFIYTEILGIVLLSANIWATHDMFYL